jgi:hypothetical protein
MTLEEFAKLLSKVGMPVAFDHFEAPQSLPFLVYVVTDITTLFGDGQNYYDCNNVQLELYTKGKDKTKESLIESLLSGAELTFSKSEGYVDDQQYYMVTYDMTI